MRTTTITATGAGRRDCARRGTEARRERTSPSTTWTSSSPADVRRGFLLYGRLAEGE